MPPGIFCIPCQRNFKTAEGMRAHLTSPSHGGGTKCAACIRLSTGDIATFTAHAKSQKHLLYCNDCPMAFHAIPELKQHRKTHSIDINISLGSLTLSSNAPNISPTGLRWSTAQLSEETELLQLCHSPQDLQESGYRLAPYTAQELEGLVKCENCKKYKNWLERMKSDSICRFHPEKKKFLRGGKKAYPCCGEEDMTGCIIRRSHTFAPIASASKYQGFEPTPMAHPGMPRFRVVVLDCEMAGGIDGSSEVISICATDFLTGSILLSKYVHPFAQIGDWRCKIHGIYPSHVKGALNRGEALIGWEGARKELWKLIDSNTILVGHSLRHDLEPLRMIHSRIVDLAILTTKAVNFGNRAWGLSTLCKIFLNLEIRNNDGKIHDCQEDVLATREVVLWCLRNKKEFNAWACSVRKEELKKAEERKKAAEEKAEKKRKEEEERIKKKEEELEMWVQPQVSTTSNATPPSHMKENQKGKETAKDQSNRAPRRSRNLRTRRVSWSEEDEVVRWEDIAESCGYPHPDTGYDPWSD